LTFVHHESLGFPTIDVMLQHNYRFRLLTLKLVNFA
jgi:hypothetical protein